MADVNVIKKTTISGAILHLDRDELMGLVRLIGNTSVNRRINDFGLTEDQSRALSKLYSQLFDQTGGIQ